ncbi:MAG: hypothetical protein IT313_06565 [Anaerolineales bacterium]|nr:hypothetical protein [Anaerolineales bacterium]
MKNHTLPVKVAFTFILLTALACNFGSAAPTSSPSSDNPENTPAVEEANPPASNEATQGGCANPYMPVSVGATWNYNMQGSSSDTYVHTVLSADNDSFVEQDAFSSGVTRQAEWKCDNGNLIALNPQGGASGTVTTEGVQADFKTTSLEGMTLPAVINPGDTWSQSITLEGVENFNGMEVPAKNQFTSHCTAIGNESVSIPAGAFDALHVDCVNNMIITITMSGSDIQTTLDFTSSSWYAPKIGMVKTVTTGSQVDSTIELVSFAIP